MASDLRPGHLERAVIVLTRVGRKEIRTVRVTFIMVNATRQPSEIGFTRKGKAVGFGRFCRENHGITEAEDFHIFRMKSGAIRIAARLGEKTAQPTGMVIDVAVP